MNLDDTIASGSGAPQVKPLLRTVLLCDIVESTALVERLGDMRAALLLQKHDLLLRQTTAFCHGQLIDKADGVLALFERPIQALDFALRYQRGLRDLGRAEEMPMKARIGVHVGDVMMWANDPGDVKNGAKPFEVEGLAKPVAARLMNLALPGQILMSGMAQNLCQRAVGELGDAGKNLRFLVHGRYRFKGVPAPMLVHEVGEPGLSPLRAPESGAKAWRELPLWRRPPVLAVEVLLVGAMVFGGLWTTLRAPPALAFAERDWVVVADLQNRTSEPLFDDALDTALRVGLEQSRHVNLISEMQIDRALARMQRPGQPVDRQLATELALREGARAVILPTVSEVGGITRVSLEVVDPQSGATVYSESADARDGNGVLAALDTATKHVRGRFGEALASIEASSKPLDQVTTDNFEALRAFSLAVEARYDSRLAEAWTLFERAVELDPEFSMAYLRMAFLRYSANDAEGTRHYLDLANRYRANLSDREALFLDAALAIPDGPRPAMERLKLLAAMYPDEHRAYYNFAYFGHHGAQRYQASLDFLAGAMVPQNPARPSAVYLSGMIQLALGNVDKALVAFHEAETLGITGGNQRAFAEAYAVRRDFAGAEARLAKQSSTGLAGPDLEQRLSEVTFAIDRGAWEDGLANSRALEADAAEVSPLNLRSQQLSTLALRSYDPDARFGDDLRAHAAGLVETVTSINAFERRHVVFELLGTGWMAIRTGDRATAVAMLEAARNLPETERFQANADMLQVLEAELALASGAPERAIELLAARAGGGDELYFVHAVLLRAYAAAGRPDDALSQADWLVARRGLAYAEFNSLNAWQPANIVESDLALAAGAEMAERLGRTEDAEARRSAFAEAWPAHARMGVVARRAADY